MNEAYTLGFEKEFENPLVHLLFKSFLLYSGQLVSQTLFEYIPCLEASAFQEVCSTFICSDCYKRLLKNEAELCPWDFWWVNLVFLHAIHKVFYYKQLQNQNIILEIGSTLMLVSWVNHRQLYGQHSGIIVACHHWQSDFFRGHLIIWENALKGQACFLSWQACHIQC